MIHNHDDNVKKVGIRQFQRNVYKNIPKPGKSILVTNHGRAYFSLTASSLKDKCENDS